MKERMMVSSLRNFIDNDLTHRVAVLVGIRRTGKTTILEQLKAYYPLSTLINFERETAWEEYLTFKDSDSGLLLIDEVTHMKDYEDVIREIEYDVHNSGRRFKVIITGSSYTHVRALYGSVLGGGRSTLFKLPILSFLENVSVNKSVNKFRNILPVERRAFVLYFLIICNLAYVEFQYEIRDRYKLEQLISDLKAVSRKQDFAEIINNYNICLVNPVLYTRLGPEILSAFNLSNY